MSEREKGGSMRDVARKAIDVALARGAQGATAGASRSRHVSVGWRDGKLERISEATTRALGLELYVDGRYGSVATSDLRPEAIVRFIEDAIAMTRALAPDPYRQLPDPALYAGQSDVDLQLEDPAYSTLDAPRRRALAAQAEEGARSVAGADAIISVTTSFGDSQVEGWRIHSNGFEGSRRATDFWLGAEVSVKDPDGRRPEDWDAGGGRHLSALPSPDAVGRGAAERALSRIGSAKGQSAKLTMAIENRAASRLVGFLLAPLSAASLQQKRSYLDGKLGVQVASGLLDLADDPLVPRGLGSRRFDGEGIAAKRLPLFEGGVLRNYYVDTYYGRKLGMAPTTRGMSNLGWRYGAEKLDALLARIGEGVYVTGFLGGNSNGTTGDFSLGAQGFRIRGGRLAEPVGEMNVSGNHLDLWPRLVAIGADPYPYSASRTPTLVFEDVQFAGT